MAVRPVTVPVDAGAENVINFRWKYKGIPIKLDGYSAEFRVKKQITDPGYLFTLSETDGIEIVPEEGLFRVTISPERSSLLSSVAEERNPFELQATPLGGKPRCISKGNLLASPGV